MILHLSVHSSLCNQDAKVNLKCEKFGAIFPFFTCNTYIIIII